MDKIINIIIKSFERPVVSTTTRRAYAIVEALEKAGYTILSPDQTSDSMITVKTMEQDVDKEAEFLNLLSNRILLNQLEVMRDVEQAKLSKFKRISIDDDVTFELLSAQNEAAIESLNAKIAEVQLVIADNNSLE